MTLSGPKGLLSAALAVMHKLTNLHFCIVVKNYFIKNDFSLHVRKIPVGREVVISRPSFEL